MMAGRPPAFPWRIGSEMARHPACLPLLGAFFFAAQAAYPASEGASRQLAWLGYKHCLEAPNRMSVPPPPGGWGNLSRLRAFRDQDDLLLLRDFKLTGDSGLVLAEPLRSGETLCLWTFDSPIFPDTTWKRHDIDDIPALDSLGRRALLLPSDSSAGTMPRFETQGPAGMLPQASNAYRLDFSGAKTMSVSLGDGGGLGLDATLKLDVNGQIAENVFVEGRLSDQNVPVLPEGNTATLKELDTKYVRLYGRQYDATLGDFEFRHGREGVDRITSKVSGVQGSYRRGGWNVEGALAQTQGIYRSDTLQGVDGKQSGYYLRARDGRIFIRVMPGTERIWRNGMRLNRGLDYTIDYAEGRVDFLNRIAVSSENLFSVEFEYAEEDYPRSLAAVSVTDTLGRWILGLRAVRLKEDEDNPLGPAADSLIKADLQAIGDEIYYDSTSLLIRTPESHAAQVADLVWRADDDHEGRLSLALTQKDANLYSGRDDDDNVGAATHFEGKQRWGHSLDNQGRGEWDANFTHDYRTPDYAAVNPWVESRQFRDLWNLDAKTGERNFSANRLELGYRPWTLVKTIGEIGYAEGETYADSTFLSIGPGVSQRYRVAGELGNGPSGSQGLEISSEAKLAESPDRRDNYRQQGRLHLWLGDWRPEFRFDRNEWINAWSEGGFNRSLQFQPAAALLWQTPFEPLQLESGWEQTQWKSLFDGRADELTDSVRLASWEQRVLLNGWGPLSGDGFYRFQRHELWTLDGNRQVSPVPQEDRYHLFEGQLRWNQGNQGFSAATHYKVQRTAELPLTGDYRQVDPGRVQYVYDSLLRDYHEVETGGDYVLVGLMRDTLAGNRPYQDIQWTADLDVAPGRMPFEVKGVLADLEFTGQIAADLQDTTSHAPVFPLLDDASIRAARSGHTRFQPQIRWRDPDGNRQITGQVSREFSKTAGLYAAIDSRFEFQLTGRQEWRESWEATLTLRLRSGERSVQGSSDGYSIQAGRGGEGHLQKQLPAGFTASAGLVFDWVEGDANGSYALTGWRPSTRLEKGFPGRGRAFAEYALQRWSGRGEGDYYALGGYAKGVTHRIETSADFELQTYLLLHANYLVRFEPRQGSPSQRMNAEIRAVF